MHPVNPPAGRRAQQVAQALESAFYPYSNHYARVYHQQTASSARLMTPEGYSYSTTFVPSNQSSLSKSLAKNESYRGKQRSQPSRGGGRSRYDQRERQQPSHWYKPGNCRCSYEQCLFTGSEESVEIHMMDRHLIYPLDWHKRKPKNDWDADPSLRNGKPIPIQGTNFTLDTPEAVETWLAERKKRWPTGSRVEEKENKLRQAVQRGELAATSSASRGRKRRRENYMEEPNGRGRHRFQNRPQASQPRVVHPLPMKPVTTFTVEVDDDDSSSSRSDLDPEKDAIPSKPLENIGAALQSVDLESTSEANDEPLKTRVQPKSIRPIPRKPPRRPKLPLSQNNPFAHRPYLLRNLLLPEIRTTMSNLSQAIHFLVENDFLRDVELNPGDADNRPIEVISETNHEPLSLS